MGIIGEFPGGEIEHQHVSSLSFESDVGPQERLAACLVGLWSVVGHVAALVDVFRLMGSEGGEWGERGEVAVSAYVELRAIYGELVEVEQRIAVSR